MPPFATPTPTVDRSVAMDIHPNLLVAIATSAFLTRDIRCDNSSKRDNKVDIIEEMAGTAKDDFDRMLFLDAIASLSVSAASAQVVAVALKQNSTNGKAILAIAENGPLDARLIPHIERLLQLLDKIADENERLPDSTTVSPILAAYRMEFIKAVYRYSVLKNLHRYKRRWDKLVPYVNKHVIQRINIHATLPRVAFINAIAALKIARDINFEILHNDVEVSDKEWADLIILMDGTVAELDFIRQYYPPAVKNLQFYRRIFRPFLKLTSQHRHIINLLALAAAGNLFTLFGSEMIVCESTIINPVAVTLPRKLQEFYPVIGSIYRSMRMDRIAEMASGVSRRALGAKWDISNTSVNQYSGRVHCECALIIYLHNSQDEQFRSYNYIGTSKLSCAPCEAWIQAFNSSMVPDAKKYYTRGTHSKWYSSWVMPPVPLTDPVTMELARILHDRLTTGDTSTAWSVKSDSTSATENGDQLIEGEEESETRRQILDFGRDNCSAGGEVNDVNQDTLSDAEMSADFG
ncbi:hypothetical protein Q9L58_009136 [Maublancomyces gigas]|uniref:Uncharacterized protein n=1 Tax=Discina gigas TaxID=1032678 RepID=A0ABR3G7S3_9PEZI